MKRKGFGVLVFKGRLRLFLKVVFLGWILSPSIAFSGQFTVTPITLVFEGGAKSGVVTVVNEEETSLQLQMKAFEWTQDAEGKDQYEETDDVLFFPKIMRLNKSEQRILRAGIKGSVGGVEKTYRLFIEEIPEPKRDPKETQIRVAIRLGVPIFVKPLKEETRGKIEKLFLNDGQLQTVVRNVGNTHFVIQSVVVKGFDSEGKEEFSKELSGWYLLPGAARTYAAAISEEVCRGAARFGVEVKTNEFTLQDKLDVEKTLCLP